MKHELNFIHDETTELEKRRMRMREVYQMKTCKLERSGKRPLCFVGALVDESSSRILDGRENDRWFDIQLYRTDDERFVVTVTYDSQCQDEERNVQVRRFKSIQSVAEFLRDWYDPLRFTNPPLKPFPINETEEQNLAAERLLRNYRIAIDAILGIFWDQIEPFFPIYTDAWKALKSAAGNGTE